jgi:hypothetical protein
MSFHEWFSAERLPLTALCVQRKDEASMHVLASRQGCEAILPEYQWPESLGNGAMDFWAWLISRVYQFQAVREMLR